MPQLSKEHKNALAEGRRQAKIVRDYLDALEADNASGAPGRPSDPGAVREKIADYQTRIDEEDDPVRRVDLIQKRLNSEQHLSNLESKPDPAEMENDFVEAAKEYSGRKASPTQRGAS